jgi:prophage regulatory protein
METTASTGERALRVTEATQRVGLSRTTLWRMARAGAFPKPRLLSPGGTCFWLESEIVTWLKSRPVK